MTTTNTNKEEMITYLLIIFFIALILTFLLYLVFIKTETYCKIKIRGDSDKYCFKVRLHGYYENVSGYYYGTEWVIRSHKQDKIDEENRLAHLKEIDEFNKNADECFNSGQWFNQSFDIMKDYNLTCIKLQYINDHLIDKSRQMDGGYISGSYSGFLSYGQIEGKMYDYATEGVLATGQLPERIIYHIDCQNSTLTKDYYQDSRWYAGDSNYVGMRDLSRSDIKEIDYYTESEFVMYYVNNCIGGG